MLYLGFQRVAAPGGMIDSTNIFQRWWWAIQGFGKTLAGTPLPFMTGDWYWLPSRVIPAQGDVEPITEFPLFTFIYSDLHAHMIVLPLTILVIAWALSVMVSRARWAGKLESVIGVGLGALVIGSLKPTNTWDYYTYLTLGVLAIGYAAWRLPLVQKHLSGVPQSASRAAHAITAMVAVIVLSVVLFQPFSQWFSQAYGSVDYWRYSHTSIGSYLTQWGPRSDRDHPVLADCHVAGFTGYKSCHCLAGAAIGSLVWCFDPAERYAGCQAWSTVYGGNWPGADTRGGNHCAAWRYRPDEYSL